MSVTFVTFVTPKLRGKKYFFVFPLYRGVTIKKPFLYKGLSETFLDFKNVTKVTPRSLYENEVQRNQLTRKELCP